MTHKQTKKIHSIQNSSDVSSLIEVETIILNGLYRFSILGINQRNTSDVKDRIYSALRAQKLLNLKSDNKKITINLLPTNVDKKDNFYDLAIALGCLVHTNQIVFLESVLAIGELSIVGNIIPSRHILKSIYHAIENNIQTIICGYRDLEIFNTYENNIIDLINKNRIRFLSADTLGELVYNIRENIYHTFKDKDDLLILDQQPNEYTSVDDKNIFKILLAICTGRNVFIENKKDSYIQKFIKNLIYYNGKLDNIDILRISNNLNKTDDLILNTCIYPKISFIDKQTHKDSINTVLKESLFGFNIIDDFITINEDLLHTIKINHTSSILCFYNPCPCGNNALFFNSFEDNRCLCLQRNILRYRQKLHKLENNFFDFYIKNIDDPKVDYTANDYINFNKIISNFRKTELCIIQDKETKELVDNYRNYDKKEIDQILDISRDVVKLEYILNKNKPVLSKISIGLAIDFIKKDF
jgi:hypothetical protein